MMIALITISGILRFLLILFVKPFLNVLASHAHASLGGDEGAILDQHRDLAFGQATVETARFAELVEGTANEVAH